MRHDSPLKSAVEIFYSYSPDDEALRVRLEKHLSLLRRLGYVESWNGRRVGAHGQGDGEISAHLNSAQIILLLVSPDFMASDYVYDVEVTRAMWRHERGEARVIPVILRPCDWRGAPFSKLQALPKDARPVTTWDDQDEALLDVAEGIRQVVERIRRGVIEDAPLA